MSVHMRYSASGAKRWIACPGSIPFADKAAVGGKQSQHAAEGGAAHLLFNKGIEHRLSAYEFMGEELEGYIVDNEMADAVQVGLDYIFSLEGEIYSELLVDASPVLGPDVGGTADVVVDGVDVLEIIDYKHGQGVYVEEINNEQMLIYVIAYAHTQHFRWSVYRLTIIQPRCSRGNGLVRTWEITRDELNAHIRRLAAHRRLCEIAADNPEKFLVPGEEQCRWCPVAGHCPALYKYVMDQALSDFGPVNPAGLSDDELAYALGNVELIRFWIKALQDHCLKRLQNGGSIPGYKLAPVYGNRTWNGDDSIDQLAKELRLPRSVMYDEKPLSPARVEKLSIEGLDRKSIKDTIAKYCSTPERGFKLTKDTAVRDFKDDTKETLYNAPVPG